jgi:hypothetical protein
MSKQEYMKQWFQRHKTELVAKRRPEIRAYKNAHPWYKTYAHIQNRCYNIKHSHYKSYGAKGIKNFLRHADLKVLWLRDNAFAMDRPSIDRIDRAKNYTLDNCRYIEYADNAKELYSRLTSFPLKGGSPT